MPRPLEGAPIVDLSRIGAGPLAPRISGGYRAEVIKIEPPRDGAAPASGLLLDQPEQDPIVPPGGECHA